MFSCSLNRFWNPVCFLKFSIGWSRSKRIFNFGSSISTMWDLCFEVEHLTSQSTWVRCQSLVLFRPCNWIVFRLIACLQVFWCSLLNRGQRFSGKTRMDSVGRSPLPGISQADFPMFAIRSNCIHFLIQFMGERNWSHCISVLQRSIKWSSDSWKPCSRCTYYDFALRLYLSSIHRVLFSLFSFDEFLLGVSLEYQSMSD